MDPYVAPCQCQQVCRQQLFFTDFTIVVAILPVVSSIDFANMEIIKIPQTNTHFDVVVKSCSYL